MPVTPAEHGVQHRWSTKNPEGVAQILQLRSIGWTLREIASVVGISYSQVGRILNGTR